MIATGYQSSGRPATIETLVMPGPVSVAHADIETECSDCHAAFSKTLQRDLCLSCHEHKSVLEDQVAGTGFHGLFEAARNVECSTCHTEHEGRDANIIQLDLESFDHHFTDFELAASHAELACEDCHAPGSLFRDAPSACFDCHQDDDTHLGRLGEDCGGCHQVEAWRTTSFDHARDTDFDLTGAHLEVECAMCHTNQRYEGIPADCYSCHQIDDYHRGEFGRDCAQCHLTEEWKKTTFSHEQESGFTLQGGHAELACGLCHQGNLIFEPLESKCVSCHLLDDIHQGGNGSNCSLCHDTQKWTNSSFDHQVDTDFDLTGAHTGLDCQACHAASQPDMVLDMACFACHQADDVHKAALGENCARCHQETTWKTDVRFDHDLTAFPLIGLHAVAPCEACHLSPEFADTPGQCGNCHARDDPHQGGLGTECGACHNPNDWRLWEFDHDASTSFSLDGAHSDLSCQSCHLAGKDYLAKPASTCIACHRIDDAHSGQFGRQCARCHTTSSFADMEMIQ